MYLQSGATETDQWLLSVPWSATPTRWKERRNLHHRGRGGSNTGKAYSRSTQSLINAETREFTRGIPSHELILRPNGRWQCSGAPYRRARPIAETCSFVEKEGPMPWYVICNA